MTGEPRTQADSPSQWLMISGGETESADLRLFARLSGSEPESETEPGSAWFVGVTRVFTGCAEDRAVLERLATSWFEHSGIAPMLAQVDVDAQAMTFWKALEVEDPTEAIRLTVQGIARAIDQTDLGGGVLRPGFSVEVIAESDIDDRP